jgi:hypothetical protein
MEDQGNPIILGQLKLGLVDGQDRGALVRAVSRGWGRESAMEVVRRREWAR